MTHSKQNEANSSTCGLTLLILSPWSRRKYGNLLFLKGVHQNTFFKSNSPCTVWLTLRKGTGTCGIYTNLECRASLLAKLCEGKMNVSQQDPQSEGTWHLHESKATQGDGNNFSPICYLVNECLQRYLGQYLAYLFSTVGYAYWTGWKLRTKLDKRDTDVHAAPGGTQVSYFVY